MQELGKFDFKINFTPNRLEKYMSINLYDKLVFIHSFQFLSFLLDSCVKNLFKNYFKHLSQEFDCIRFSQTKSILSLWTYV